MDAKDWIPIAISALSLLVSAYTLFMQHRQSRECLSIKLSNGFALTGGAVSEPMLLAEAANVGHRPVTVSSYGLKMPDDKVLLFPFRGQHVNLPYELQPGKSCTMHMPSREVARALLEHGHREAKLVLQFSAQSGRKFSAKPFKFNAEAWSQ